MPRNSTKLVGEAKWEAERDARTVAEYNAIMSDPKRKDDAQRAAMGMLTEKEAEVKGLKKLVRSKKTSRKKK